MTGIDNTARRLAGTPEADMILTDARGGGTWGPGAIEEMEREGKAQLLNSDRLPTDVRDREAFEALGFTFGDPDPDDPMFMPATFPPGWKREGSSHAMWSYVVDDLGRHRVAVFYKAAFYDRSAFMRLETLCWYVTEYVEYGKPLAFDDKWATREAVLAEMRQARESNLKEAADFRRYAADDSRRDERNRAHCARIADEKEATAAKYEAAAAELAAATTDSRQP